jgi:signal transduction histidine kinase
MKKFIFLLLISFASLNSFTQNSATIELYKDLALASDDASRMMALANLYSHYVYTSPDSSFKYGQERILLAHKMGSDQLIADAYTDFVWCFVFFGDYPQALYYDQEGLKAAERSGNKYFLCRAYDYLEMIYEDLGDYELAYQYITKAMSIWNANWSLGNLKKGDSIISRYVSILQGLTSVYEKRGQLDSSLICVRILDSVYEEKNGKRWAAAAFAFGNVYAKMELFDSAKLQYRAGIRLAAETNTLKDIIDNYNGLANVFSVVGKTDSAIFYANIILELTMATHFTVARLQALTVLAGAYKKKHNIDSIAKYLDISMTTRDSLFSRQKSLRSQSLTFNEQVRQREILEAENDYKNRVRIYALAAGFLIVLLFAGILYRNNLAKQKANKEIEKAYRELKSTQSSLIQSEKMASLGELTAGIAHEIQNPLNFVNNFSQINTELIDEAQVAINRSKTVEAIDLLSNLRNNEVKITEHGQRADAIVKAMMLHSRTGSGQKELVDINALADEYLKLSYQGQRSKDKHFNARIITNFDLNVGKINIIPQDISRVLVNLYNNAFYALNERRKQSPNGYEPDISVTTKKVKEGIQILIEDNGNGIPENIRQKIFQPFFTTKPTGQGTGLGLSLAYEIIKAHGGEIRVETKEGEGSLFVIQLPV